MNLQLTWQILNAPFILAALIALGLSLYAFQIKSSRPARTFAWFALCISFWVATSALENASIAIETKIFWTSLKYLGSTFSPILALVLALQNTRLESITKKLWFNVLIYGWAISTTLVVWTNPLHHWYWTGFYLPENHLEIMTHKNWWFGIYAAGMYIFTLAATFIYFWYLRKAPSLFKKQALLLALGGFLPLFFRMLSDFAGIVFIPYVDQVVILIFVSVIFYAIAMFRYGALKLVPVAHDQVIKTMQSAVVVTDDQLRILEINPAAAHMFNIEINAAIGLFAPRVCQVKELIHADNTEVWLEQADHLQHRCYQIQTASIRPNNHNPKQNIIGWSFIFNDITALKESETKLAAANKQRQQMASDIAHDLRTPIQIVSGYLEAMGDGILQPSEKKLSSMSKEMEHLGKLVTDFMLVSKAHSGDLVLQIAPSSINELLERIDDAYTHKAHTEKKTLEVGLIDHDEDISVDEDRIMQVLHNLVRNAFNHTRAGDSIKIYTEKTPTHCIFYIQDSGKGIQPEHLNLLFDRTFRADPTRQRENGSNGLGLAICQSLIHAHHGDIGVHSDGLEQGARFWFSLSL